MRRSSIARRRRDRSRPRAEMRARPGRQVVAQLVAAVNHATVDEPENVPKRSRSLSRLARAGKWLTALLAVNRRNALWLTEERGRVRDLGVAVNQRATDWLTGERARSGDSALGGAATGAPEPVSCVQGPCEPPPSLWRSRLRLARATRQGRRPPRPSLATPLHRRLKRRPWRLPRLGRSALVRRSPRTRGPVGETGSPAFASRHVCR
jgi:hypothetical protein